MNQLVFAVACGLSALDAVLITVRFARYHGQKPPTLETGSCKTIGTREVQEDSFDVRTAAAVVREGKLFYALAGNIRVAVWHGGDLIPASDGHTVDKLAEKKYAEGGITRQDALKLLERRRLYNYVGQDGFRDLELFDAPWPLESGDVVALLSDGVYDCLPWRGIEEILAKGGTCEQAALEIVEAVNQSGDGEKDNASVVLLRYRGAGG